MSKTKNISNPRIVTGYILDTKKLQKHYDKVTVAIHGDIFDGQEQGNTYKVQHLAAIKLRTMLRGDTEWALVDMTGKVFRADSFQGLYQLIAKNYYGAEEIFPLPTHRLQEFLGDKVDLNQDFLIGSYTVPADLLRLTK